jgi:hypothetical protein
MRRRYGSRGILRIGRRRRRRVMGHGVVSELCLIIDRFHLLLLLIIM